MSRLEENKKVIEEMIKRAADKSPVTYQEMMTFQTDAIVNMLADISKSFAILADRAEKEQTLDNIEEVYLNLMRTQAKYEDKIKVLDKIKEEIEQYRDSLPCDNTSISKFYAINYILGQIFDKYINESETEE